MFATNFLIAESKNSINMQEKICSCARKRGRAVNFMTMDTAKSATVTSQKYFFLVKVPADEYHQHIDIKHNTYNT